MEWDGYLGWFGRLGVSAALTRPWLTEAGGIATPRVAVTPATSMSPPDLAIYAGSFDPVTFGHLDLVERVSRIFGQVVVAVGIHPTRVPLFTDEERLEMLTEVCRPFSNVRVQAFDGLLINFARRIGARVIVRGLRAGSDFEYELQIAHSNADLAPELDTVFLPTRTNYGFISASLVREIARHNGEIERYAPQVVCAALKRKFGFAR